MYLIKCLQTALLESFKVSKMSEKFYGSQTTKDMCKSYLQQLAHKFFHNQNSLFIII